MTHDFVELDVIEPCGIVQVYRDYWWWCEDGDPRRALFYKPKVRDHPAPQCNYHREICERIGLKLKYGETAKLVQIPIAFVPWDTRRP